MFFSCPRNPKINNPPPLHLYLLALKGVSFFLTVIFKAHAGTFGRCPPDHIICQKNIHKSRQPIFQIYIFSIFLISYSGVYIFQSVSTGRDKSSHWRFCYYSPSAVCNKSACGNKSIRSTRYHKSACGNVCECSPTWSCQKHQQPQTNKFQISMFVLFAILSMRAQGLEKASRTKTHASTSSNYLVYQVLYWYAINIHVCTDRQ